MNTNKLEMIIGSSKPSCYTPKGSYVNYPTQVKFWDNSEKEYKGGIAIFDFVICGCCGAPLNVEYICKNTPEGIKPIVKYDDWINISKDIMGD